MSACGSPPARSAHTSRLRASGVPEPAPNTSGGGWARPGGAGRRRGGRGALRGAGAGRGARRGRAVIQTVTPENELLSLAARQDYESFYRTEIIIRKNLVYPPWCDLCVFNFRGTKEPRVAAASAAFIRSFHDNIVSAGGIKTVIIGPVSPPISKLNNMFRRRIIVKCICNKKFRGVVSGSLKDFMNDTKFRDVSVSVDINPASIY